jgi:hypothetical protein
VISDDSVSWVWRARRPALAPWAQFLSGCGLRSGESSYPRLICSAHGDGRCDVDPLLVLVVFFFWVAPTVSGMEGDMDVGDGSSIEDSDDSGEMSSARLS